MCVGECVSGKPNVDILESNAINHNNLLYQILDKILRDKTRGVIEAFYVLI